MSYLIFETLEAAKARSASQAAHMGFQKNSTTKYWWSWSKTADAKWALSIPESEASHLSELEQSSLVSKINLVASEGI